jgi:hypothetical protein
VDEGASAKNDYGLLAGGGAPVGARAFGLQTLERFSEAPLFHELYAGEQFEIFRPLIAGERRSSPRTNGPK